MTAPLPMSELARRWSELAVADVPPGESLTRAATASGSLLRPPATEQAISAAEERLGRGLPPSYREFLEVSDGAYGDVDGASWSSESGWEVAPVESAVIGVGFLPVMDLRWLRDVDPSMADMCAVAGSDPEPVPVTDDGASLDSRTGFARGLTITVDHGPGQTCLVPFDGVEEWEVWSITKETSQGFRSFRSMLEYTVATLEPIVTLDEFERIVVRASRGDRLAVTRLFRTTVPEAVPRLIGLATDSRLGAASVGALGRIGTAEAVEALATMKTWFAVEALARAGTEQARDVLAQRGEFFALSILGDPRGAEIAADRIANRSPSGNQWPVMSALHALARSRDPRFVPLVMPLLSDDESLALSAARTLAWLGAPEGRSRIEELAGRDGPVRILAHHMLRVLEDGYLP